MPIPTSPDAKLMLLVPTAEALDEFGYIWQKLWSISNRLSELTRTSESVHMTESTLDGHARRHIECSEVGGTAATKLKVVKSSKKWLSMERREFKL